MCLNSVLACFTALSSEYAHILYAHIGVLLHVVSVEALFLISLICYFDAYFLALFSF